MPISKTTDVHNEEYWTRHYENFLVPLAKEVDDSLQVSRSKALRGDILHAIIKDLIFSAIVIADLTDGNSNVFWELGVRQSFVHGTITIMEDGTKLPFDLGAKGSLKYYPNDHLKNEAFRSQMKEALKDCLEHPERPDSHVLEAISGRGSIFEIIHRAEIIRRLDALLSEIETNKRVLSGVTQTFEKNRNKAESKKYTFSVRRFILPSTELLLCEQYLDESDEFYRPARTYYGRLTDLNDELNLWPVRPTATQKWLTTTLEREDGSITEIIHRFEKQVLQAREKLASRL